MEVELRKAVQLAWRRFLQSEFGIEGLLYLRGRAPKIGRGDSHAIIFDAGRVEGYREGMDGMSDMAGKEPVKHDSLENE